ncbi:unnamed protein product, partial [marine sediment metagenome]
MSFADKHPRLIEAAFALHDAAVLYELLYRRFGGRDRIEGSARLLERLARDYPGHKLADDALVRRGDLLLYELNDVAGARKSYLEVVEAYRNADMYEVARVRLRSIDEGTYQKTSKSSESSKSLEKQAHVDQGPLVLIDPGHGGDDFGAQGKGGLLEKDVVLDIALRLEKLLVEKLNAVVRLTRRKDVFVPLAERTNLANDFEADVFISLHTNASPKGKVAGLETYFLDNTNDKASRKLAERENRSMRFEGSQSDLQFMLSDLIQNAKLEDSIV